MLGSLVWWLVLGKGFGPSSIAEQKLLKQCLNVSDFTRAIAGVVSYRFFGSTFPIAIARFTVMFLCALTFVTSSPIEVIIIAHQPTSVATITTTEPSFPIWPFYGANGKSARLYFIEPTPTICTRHFTASLASGASVGFRFEIITM